MQTSEKNGFPRMDSNDNYEYIQTRKEDLLIDICAVCTSTYRTYCTSPIDTATLTLFTVQYEGRWIRRSRRFENPTPFRRKITKAQKYQFSPTVRQKTPMTTPKIVVPERGRIRRGRTLAQLVRFGTCETHGQKLGPYLVQGI